MDEMDATSQDSSGTVDGAREAPATDPPDVAVLAGNSVAEGQAQTAEPHNSQVAGGEPARVEPPEIQTMAAVPESQVTVAEESPAVLIAAEPAAAPSAPYAPPPGFLLGSEVASSARLRQPAFDRQLSLLEQRAELKKKVYTAVIVIASVLLAGIIAGAVLGLFV